MLKNMTLTSFILALLMLVSCGGDDEAKKAKPQEPVVPEQQAVERITRTITSEPFDPAVHKSTTDLAFLQEGNVIFFYDGKRFSKPISSVASNLTLTVEDIKAAPGQVDLIVSFKPTGKWDDIEWLTRWNYYYSVPDGLDHMALVQYNPHAYIAYRDGVYFAIKLDTLSRGELVEEEYGFADQRGLDTLSVHWTIIRKVSEEEARQYIQSWPKEKQATLMVSADVTWNSRNYPEGTTLMPPELYRYIVRMGSGTGIDSLSGNHLWGWWKPEGGPLISTVTSQHILPVQNSKPRLDGTTKDLHDTI